MRLPVVSRMSVGRWVVCTGAALLLTACGGGGSSSSSSGSGGGSGGGTPTTYTVGGTVSGLKATGLVLTDNGGNSLTVASGASTFTFSQALQSGATYAVAVSTQPSGETCSVGSGSGTVSGTVTSVTVTCQPLYTVGGTVTGLTASGLTLKNNGTETVTIPYTSGQSGPVSFTFAQSVPAGTAYDVTVGSQPSGETCTVSAGSGTVSANVTSIAVSCVQSFTVSGTVSGLGTGGLQLLDYSGGETLSVAANATKFAFTQPVASGTNISVSVAQQPYWEWCTGSGSNFSGPITANVTQESFTCASATATSGAAAPGQTYSSPAQIALDGNGNLYVADSGNSEILEISPSGGVTTLLNSGLNAPQGVAVNAAGTELYVADTSNNRILAVALPSLAVTPLVTSGLKLPAAVAVDPVNGDIIVADTGNSEIKQVTPAGVVTTLAGASAGVSGPYGVAVDASGTIYVANTGASNVLEISASGTVSALNGVIAGTLSNPSGVTVDAAGDVYVANTNDADVVQVTPAGTVQTVAGTGHPPAAPATCATTSPVQFANPWGVAVTSAGTLFVSDYLDNQVCKLTPGP